MNALDVFIVLMVISSLFRGHEIGLIRQLFSTVGFIGGLFLGAWLEQYTVNLVETSLSRSLMTIGTTLGCAVMFLIIGEYLGGRLKMRVRPLNINKVDSYFGSVIGAVTLLVAIWLATAIMLVFPSTTIQSQIRGSSIVTSLNLSLPPAPDVIGSLGRLIDPNGFPQVFTGSEPNLPENTSVPGIGADMQAAIDRTKGSIVKFEGIGCGGVVNGSGFVISNDLVITNAHVIAGVSKPYVRDANGQHSTSAVWFDPDLDFAIVRVQNLSGQPLLINNALVSKGTQAAVLGHPSGGGLTAGGAEVLDDFTARGRDIYGNGLTERDVYSLAAKVVPGNSGGPVIAADGTVIGIIFAQSTVYQTVGYALSTPQVLSAISQAQAQNRTVATGSCVK